MNDKKWWFVFNPYQQNCPKVRHETLESAQNEAKRLCDVTHQKIHVLECIGTFHPPCGPIWKDRK